MSRLHREITEAILASAFDVSNTLGCGFLEKVYENAMVVALEEAGLKVMQQVPLRVHYRDVLVESAASLASRYSEKIGCVKAYDGDQWKFPILIDHMMNVELMYLAARNGGNPDWKRMAEQHSLNTIRTCIREDGSANMIAWNGHPCGTAPEWGAPEWVIERLYRRRPDPAWLAKVLDPFTAYLSWWDRHRTDKKGFAHYLCSYESGQDMSPRFNPQRGGGDDTRHCRAVDLQAAMARGWAFVAEARAQLGREADARTAARRAAHYRRRMEMLWSGDWYHDDNLKSRSASALYDVMHLAPFFYGLAATQRADAVRSRLMRLYQDKPQVWPTFMLMLAESTYRVGCSEMLSTMASERIAHIYAATDARRVTRTGPLPGVQHEYWPDRPAWGAEGYGWGTFGIALLVRYLAGWREEGQSLDDPGFTLAPALPTQLCRRGRVLHLHNLPALSRRFDLSYTVKPGGEMGLTVRMQRGKAVGEMQFLDASGNVLATACGKDPLQAVVRNHHRYRVVVKSLENMRKGKKKSEQLHRQ